MPITTAFSLAAMVAGVLNAIYLYRAIRRQGALRQAKLNGELAVVANAFVLVWTMIVINDVFMLVAGLGLLSGVRLLGFLLVGIPLNHIILAIFALRGLD